MIELGCRVEDITTGFKGIVIAKLEFLDGRISYGVVANCSEESTISSPQYVSEGYLRVIDKGVTIPQLPKRLGFTIPPERLLHET